MKDIKKISVDGVTIKSSSKQEVGKNTKQGTNSINGGIIKDVDDF